MAIATNCPNCNAKFNLADELEGKTVKCKRCQSSFVVPSADAIASKPPRSSARDDDDEDEDDRDRSAPPPLRKSRRRDEDEDDDDRDDEEEDEEPRRRRPRRRSEERERRGRRKAKGGSSMMAIVLVLVGVGVLFLFCCGVGGVVAWINLRDPAGAGGANTRVALGADGSFRHENRLTRFDRSKNGKRFRTYNVHLEAGKTYQIDMVSDQLDSFLFLIDDRNQIVALDDDGGGFPHARIVFRADRTGEYTIEATSFMNNESGTFFLTVRRL